METLEERIKKILTEEEAEVFIKAWKKDWESAYKKNHNFCDGFVSGFTEGFNKKTDDVLALVPAYAVVERKQLKDQNVETEKALEQMNKDFAGRQELKVFEWLRTFGQLEGYLRRGREILGVGEEKEIKANDC